MRTGGWLCVPEDATCGMGGTQSSPCFKSIAKGPESRERFLLLPKVVADVWYVGKTGQTCACCCAVRLPVAYGGGLLLAAELPVWWLLLLGNTAGSGGSFQLCPDTQLLGSPEK